MSNVCNTTSIVLDTPDVESFSIISISEKKPRKKIYEICKRIIDIILSILALICLSPIFFITALAIKLDSKGPVIYTQYRVGKNGKRFKMYKFRSMCADAAEKLKDIRSLNEKEGPIFKITNDPRVTRIGKIIRKSSIDELPQLFNIFRGDMTIVGPRPPLVNEFEQYTPYQAQRLCVTPGLTCYWQISGRSNLSFQEWVELDIKYINERGFLTDLKIILRTIPAVIFGVGAY
jgi:exopolysaccharide biosynthesis polyprenyl glycosylphosphotransferase